MGRMQDSNFLEFSKKERNGIVLCLILIGLLLWLPSLYEKIYPPVIPVVDIFPDSVFQPGYSSKNMDESRYRKINDEIQKNISGMPDKFSLKPFTFDPNTQSFEGWLKMGLREKTAQTVIHYISKGGKFKEPEDLKKIWGISPDEAKQLIPFVKIQQQATVSPKKYQNSSSSKDTPLGIVDINTCDSAALEQLPGIGPSLARRIIQYRKSLGGFYSVSQVGETFGLADSVFQKIKHMMTLPDIACSKININNANLEELKKHPYIRYQLATAIIRYREQHGLFKSTEDLKNIFLIDKDIYKKIFYYVKID